MLVGHSHIALAIGLDDDELHGGPAPAGTEIELEGRWLLNPARSGSRATATRARHGSRSTRMRSGPASTASPIRSSERRREMREPGFPAPLAERLAQGV